MLLLDDEDELPRSADEAEALVLTNLGPDGLKQIDANIRKCARPAWLKVARVVADALAAGEFPLDDENIVRVHLRRVGALVEAGVLESRGEVTKPRWSEVRVGDPTSGRSFTHATGPKQ